MLTELAFLNPIVGIKQSRRAVSDGIAQKAYVAQDADPDIMGPFCSLCKECGVEVVEVDTMEELGRACGINVGAAVAVLPK